VATKHTKTVDPPRTLWIVLDARTGHPLFMVDDPSKADLMNDEMIYRYTLDTPKPRRANG
jgi:hypothetical protein